MILTLNPEVYHNLRAYFPLCSSRSAIESETACRSARGGNIPIRHLEHDSALHNWNLSQPKCDMCFISVIRELLHCVSNAKAARRISGQAAIPCTTRAHLRCSNIGRGPHLRYIVTQSHKCGRGTSCASLMHCAEQRRYTTCNCFRDRNYYSSFFSSAWR